MANLTIHFFLLEVSHKPILMQILILMQTLCKTFSNTIKLTKIKSFLRTKFIWYVFSSFDDDGILTNVETAFYYCSILSICVYISFNRSLLFLLPYNGYHFLCLQHFCALVDNMWADVTTTWIFGIPELTKKYIFLTKKT